MTHSKYVTQINQIEDELARTRSRSLRTRHNQGSLERDFCELLNEENPSTVCHRNANATREDGWMHGVISKRRNCRGEEVYDRATYGGVYRRRLTPHKSGTKGGFTRRNIWLNMFCNKLHNETVTLNNSTQLYRI